MAMKSTLEDFSTIADMSAMEGALVPETNHSTSVKSHMSLFKGSNSHVQSDWMGENIYPL